MDKALTPLEAAMLGLYLMGCRVMVLEYSRGGRPVYVAAEKNWGTPQDRDWCLSRRLPLPDEMQPMFDSLFPNWRKKTLIELLPWLQAHNVPIPEASDAK